MNRFAAWLPSWSPRETGPEVAELLLLDQHLVRKLIALAHSRFGIDESDAEDLVQETALEIARSPSLIASPDGFAFQVFHNRCVRFLDRQVKRRRVFVAAAEGERGLPRTRDWTNGFSFARPLPASRRPAGVC